MKKNNKVYLLILSISSILFLSADYLRSVAPPAGFTGENPGETCNNCHNSFPLNQAGGSVNATIPLSYKPGNNYDFSVSIQHFSTDRKKWGFAIKAVSNGEPVGTFSTTNPNTKINQAAAELTHNNAVSTPEQDSFTYDRLVWTAPTNSNSTDTVIFYLAGNAANGNNSSSGDYIYTNIIKMIPETPTSVSNHLLSEDQWRIIPSGGDILVHLNLKKSTKLQVSIFTTGGQKIAENPVKTFPSGTNTLQLGGNRLKSGTYIVVLQNEQGKLSRKIIL